jgi:hypothetical protein
LRTAEEYYRAATVFQHGSQPQDFLTAHLLATIAGSMAMPGDAG